jgi:hypothetical protein
MIYEQNNILCGIDTKISLDNIAGYHICHLEYKLKTEDNSTKV